MRREVFSVVSSERVFDGVVASVRVDEVVMPGGGTAKREVVEHGGAVAVVALDTAGPLDQAADFDVVDAEESADMVILIEQYRHPLGRRLWELPAGSDGHRGRTGAGGRGPRADRRDRLRRRALVGAAGRGHLAGLHRGDRADLPGHRI